MTGLSSSYPLGTQMTDSICHRLTVCSPAGMWDVQFRAVVRLFCPTGGALTGSWLLSRPMAPCRRSLLHNRSPRAPPGDAQPRSSPGIYPVPLNLILILILLLLPTFHFRHTYILYVRLGPLVVRNDPLVVISARAATVLNPVTALEDVDPDIVYAGVPTARSGIARDPATLRHVAALNVRRARAVASLGATAVVAALGR